MLRDNSSLIDFSGCKDTPPIDEGLTTCTILKKLLEEDSNALGSVRALSLANMVYTHVEDSLTGLSDFKGLVMLNLRGLCQGGLTLTTLQGLCLPSLQLLNLNFSLRFDQGADCTAKLSPRALP